MSEDGIRMVVCNIIYRRCRLVKVYVCGRSQCCVYMVESVCKYIYKDMDIVWLTVMLGWGKMI